jgi:hypothetical protein
MNSAEVEVNVAAVSIDITFSSARLILKAVGTVDQKRMAIRA